MRVHKAGPVRGSGTPDLLIEATVACPETFQAGDFEVEAAMIFAGLVASLPPQTVARLTVLLLKRQVDKIQGWGES